MPTPIFIPTAVPSSDSSDAKIQIEICKTLSTTKETRECLVQLQKDRDHDSMVAVGILVAIVIVMIAVAVWMTRD